jgi:outer membrane protein assembly factor BamE
MVGGCSLPQVAQDGRLLGLVTPYRIDIVEGNAVTREQVALVRPGMSRAQVRDVLGSPMLTDPFHAGRWDYFFSFRRAGQPAQQRHVVAHFEGDMLARLEVPENLPSEHDFVAAIDPTPRRATRPPALELTAEQRAALPTPARPAAAAPAPSPSRPDRNYPPLEP